MVARGWSEAQKRAYVIADNKLALNAGWDVELLRVELTDLKAMGADLGLVGFADEELAELFADRSAGLTDPDDIPERAARAGVVPAMCGCSGSTGWSAATAPIRPPSHRALNGASRA